MNGKATLILTDKDTGKTVKKIEEHNMATNVPERIINVPAETLVGLPKIDFYTPLFPVWKNLLSGVVMFENQLEENPERFMIPPDAVPVGSAGTAYTGTNPKRGTLNASQSGPIENGYRFVWDFAPEKAIGTIRCLGLTHYLYGNWGFLNETANSQSLTTMPQYMDGSNANGSAAFITVPETFCGKVKGTDYYSFKIISGGIMLYVYRAANVNSIKILTSYDEFIHPVLISQKQVDMPFTLKSVWHHFYNSKEDVLYFFFNKTDSARTVNIFEYVGVNADTGEIVKKGSAQIPFTATYNTLAYAFFDNRLYVCVTNTLNNIMYVFNASGGLIRTEEMTPSINYDFFMSNGYLMATENGSNRYRKFFVDHGNFPPGNADNHRHTETDAIRYPYAVKYNPETNNTSLTLILRTDYLATINNLSEPLEKTDRHALQIRYEITN